MNKNFLYAGVAILSLLPGAAYAADIIAPEPAPEALWNGMYIGAVAGWADGKADFDYTRIKSGEAKCSKVSHCFGKNLDMDGFFGGATLGYNLQTTGNLVFGIETDIVGGNIEGDYESDFIYGSRSTKAVVNRADAEIDLSGTVRARLGMAVGSMGQTLLYVTGGGAWATYEASYQQDKYTGCTSFDCGPDDKKKSKKYVSRDGSLFGFAVGAGIEYALTEQWTIKGEYLYTDYVTDSTKTDKFKFDTDIGLNNFRVGINFLF
jgi:outer membrane immunogenic protein